MHKDLMSTRNRMDAYSKESLEAKNVCSMQLILINEKDRTLRDKEKELRELRREVRTTSKYMPAYRIISLLQHYSTNLSTSTSCSRCSRR